MKKAELIKLGLTEEQADAALIIHGIDIESHKAKVETLSTENKTLADQVLEASATIENFKKLDVTGIQKTADEWKTKAEQTEQELTQTREEAENAIAEMEFNQTLKESLLAANAKNPVAVSALLDFDKLEVAEDGSIKGLDEQLKVIKSENDYLFTSDEDNPQFVLGGHSTSVIGDSVVDAARQAAGLKVNT